MSSIRPIPDVSASLADAPTSELLLRAFAIVKRWSEVYQDDDVTLEVCRFNGEWMASLRTGSKEQEGFRSIFIGIANDPAEALRKVIAEASGKDEPELAPCGEYEHGQVGAA